DLASANPGRDATPRDLASANPGKGGTPGGLTVTTAIGRTVTRGGGESGKTNRPTRVDDAALCRRPGLRVFRLRAVPLVVSSISRRTPAHVRRCSLLPAREHLRAAGCPGLGAPGP